MLKRDSDINKSSVNSDGWNYNMDECPLDTCVHLLSDNKDILLPQMDFVGTITMDINKGYKTRGMCYWGDPDCFYRSEIIAWKPFPGNEEAIKKHGYNQGVNAMYSISHGSR